MTAVFVAVGIFEDSLAGTLALNIVTFIYIAILEPINALAIVLRK